MQTFGVATKAIIYNDKGEFLILRKSSKEDINPNTYDLPGGRIKFGEKLEEAVKREVKEETGLDVKPQSVFNAWTFTKGEDFQLTGVDFICKFIGGEQKLSEEHDKIEWLTLVQVKENKTFPEWLTKTIEKAQKVINM